MLTIAFILIFLAAILFSMLGLGGGTLYVPLLIAIGLSFHAAAATSLSLIIVMSLTAAVTYQKNRLIDWHLFLVLEPASILGAWIGSNNSQLFPEKTLLIIFAVIMVIASLLLLKPAQPRKIKEKEFPGFYHRDKDGYHYTINLWAGIPLALFAGFISSILGIGGGFAKVPMMALLFGVPIKIAVATSSAMIVLTAGTGLFGHSALGHLNYKMAAILSAAVLVGAFIGSRISVKADQKFLSRLFAVIQIVTAGWMVYKALV
jgi:uncharacterized protein